jgi:predicted MarR family transcription regulator
LRVLVAKITPKSEMARGFMDVRRAMKAMEGAYPNDPNRSILSLNIRPKDNTPQSAIVA